MDYNTREQVTQWPLSHTTPNVLNKSIFSTEADPKYVIPILHICTNPILWDESSMTRMDRTYKWSSPFQSWAQRLCSSHIAGWALTDEGPIKLRVRLQQTRSGVTAGHTPGITQQDHGISGFRKWLSTSVTEVDVGPSPRKSICTRFY